MSGAALAGAIDGYESNVFVNCPFDDKYLALLRPLLFTIAYVGYRPRIAAERSDSGENRLDKICELIRQSKFSIHDLSRLKAARARELYRDFDVHGGIVLRVGSSSPPSCPSC